MSHQPISSLSSSHCVRAVALAAAISISLGVSANSGSEPFTAAIGADLVESGSTWYPDIPANLWSPFLVHVTPGTTTLGAAQPVGSIGVSVIDPVAAGHAYPKDRTPSVLYRIGLQPEELSQPISIVWPNVDGYAPGDAHLVFALDTLTAQWEVCGSAVVSADGLSLVQADASFNTRLTDYFIDQNVLLTFPGQ